MIVRTIEVDCSWRRITFIGKRTLHLQSERSNENPSKVDVRRARNSFPPNFIHAMDASHMFRTINAAKDQGVIHFGTVHDSFGTHCVNMPILNQATKDAFVEMYDGWCPLEALVKELERVISKEAFQELPDLPPKGDLDVREVAKSDYFFS